MIISRWHCNKSPIKNNVITNNWLSLDDMIEEDQTNRLNADQKVLIKDLFSQGVKHKMKVNISRQLSRPSGKERWEASQPPDVSNIPVWTRQLSVTSRADFETSLAETEAEELAGLESEVKKGNSDHTSSPQPSPPPQPQSCSSVDRVNRGPLDWTKFMIEVN